MNRILCEVGKVVSVSPALAVLGVKSIRRIEHLDAETYGMWRADRGDFLSHFVEPEGV